MEDIHRNHKEAPFGWLAMLQDFLATRAAHAPSRSVGRRDGRLPVLTLPSDLHHLAGPH